MLVAGTVSVMLLTEMCGRLAAVSHHTLADAIRERLGLPYFALPLVGELLVDALVLTAEIGGVAVALPLLFGHDYRLWVPFVSFAAWLLLWRGTFGLIENGVSAVGLVTLAFVAGAFALHAPWHQVAAAIVPRLPDSDRVRYWYVAVNIMGSVPLLILMNDGAYLKDQRNSVLGNVLVTVIGVTFGGRWHGYRVRWDQIDLEDPRRLRLTCGVEDLGRLPAPQKRRAG